MTRSLAPTRITPWLLGLVFFLSLGCSHRSSDEPATITFVDPEWAHDLAGLNVGSDVRLEQFTRATEIRVRHRSLPENSLAQLDAMRGLLGKEPSAPDVSGIDVIWPGMLGAKLTDLKPHLATELSSMNPDVVESYTVGGKVVAVPYRTDIGVLFYRKDLLRAYGYQAPPKTWDELEKMASRIQQGERAKGLKKFWGFLWPGAAGEGLTCNALEWQAAEGGGQIIEADRTISVNNPHAIRAWQRAAHWSGWISPPSVTSYEEWDAINEFFSGEAVFFRGWALSYLFGLGGKPADPERFGIANVPGGKGGQAGTLGGFGLGVPQSAPHPAEALKLVQFLVEREKHSEVSKSSLADIWKMNWSGGIVSRPSVAAGEKYEEVDHAYIKAVHSVLTGEATAPNAAVALEKQLISITGFKTGPPRPSRSGQNESAKELP